MNLRKLVLVVCVGLLWMSCAAKLDAAVPTIIFSAGFESSQGYDLDQPLSGQNGWEDNGFTAQGIVTNFFDSSDQQAYIGFAFQTNRQDYHEVRRPVHFDPLTSQLAQVSFSVRLAIFDSTTTNHDDFRWSLVTTNGDRLFSVDFDGSAHTVNYALETGGFVSTGVSYAERTEYHLGITMNFARNLWSATLDEIPIVLGQPITTAGSKLSLGYIAARWVPRPDQSVGDDYMVFDDYEITAEPDLASPSTPIFFTSFEFSEGYQLATLAGQNGWLNSGSGGNGIVTNFFEGEKQTAYLGFGAPTNGEPVSVVLRPIHYLAAPGQPPRLHFSTLMAVYDSTTTNGGAFAWAFINADGKKLFTVVFDDTDHSIGFLLDDDSGRKATGQSFQPATAYTLNIDMDLAVNRWSASLEGVLLATNQPITTLKSALTLGSINAFWLIRHPTAPGDDFMIFDRLQLSAETAPRPTLLLQPLSSGGPVLLRLFGEAGIQYSIEASLDLQTWTPIKTISSSDGVSEFVDNAASVLLKRFYRARRGART
ncbi:MAG: hypothetical protein ABI651_10645, partial [Verrucomicrobiota bacterium]